MNHAEESGCRGGRARSFRARRVAVCACGLIGAGLFSGCLPKVSWFARTDQAQQLAQQARQAEDRGDSSQAEHLLTSAVEINPRDCETRIELSDLLLEHGSCDAAVDHLKQVVKQDPDDPRALVKLGLAMRVRGDLRESARLADAALNLDPSNSDSLVLRGLLHEQQKQDEAALRLYYRALHANPDRTDASLRVAAVQLRRKAPRQAGAVARGLLERPGLSPASRAEAQWLLGLAYSQEQRWILAAGELEAASAGRALSADDWYQLAYASWQAGHPARAGQAADEALRLDPRHAEALALDIRLARQTATSDPQE